MFKTIKYGNHPILKNVEIKELADTYYEHEFQEYDDKKMQFLLASVIYGENTKIIEIDAYHDDQIIEFNDVNTGVGWVNFEMYLIKTRISKSRKYEINVVFSTIDNYYLNALPIRVMIKKNDTLEDLIKKYMGKGEQYVAGCWRKNSVDEWKEIIREDWDIFWFTIG